MLVYLLGGSRNDSWVDYGGGSTEFKVSQLVEPHQAIDLTATEQPRGAYAYKIVRESYRKIELDLPFAVFAADAEAWGVTRARFEIAQRNPQPPQQPNDDHQSAV